MKVLADSAGQRIHVQKQLEARERTTGKQQAESSPQQLTWLGSGGKHHNAWGITQQTQKGISASVVGKISNGAK